MTTTTATMRTLDETRGQSGPRTSSTLSKFGTP